MKKIALSLCCALSAYLFFLMPLTLLAKTASDTTYSLPQGEIIFVIDESGSMGNEIDEVKAHVTHIATQLGDVIDFQLGLVGFGGKNDNPRLVRSLSSDVNSFSAGLDELSANGGIEPGFSATVMALSDEMGFRPGAGTCIIMITDEDADIETDEDGNVVSQTQSDALTALESRNAIFLGVVDPTRGDTSNQYGPNNGSLAQQTGGQLFNIVDFRANPEPILSGILDQCADGLISPQHSTLALSPSLDTIRVSDTIKIDLLVSHVSDFRSTQVQIEFNPDVLELIDENENAEGLQISPGRCPDPTMLLMNQADNDTGIIRYVVTSFNASCNANPTDLVASMNFRAHQDGKGWIKLTTWELANSLGQSIPITDTIDSSITVESTAMGSAEGTLRLIGREADSQYGQSYYEGVAITVTDHNNTIIATSETDSFGYYELNNIPMGIYTVTAQIDLYLLSQESIIINTGQTTNLSDLVLWPGDNNGDGKVNILDLLPLFQLLNANESFSAGITCASPPNWDPVTEAKQSKIDFNADCKVDVGDVALHSTTIAAFFKGSNGSVGINVPVVPVLPGSSALSPTPW